jgi:secondary thiamine-phosphate synthase enzyme
MKQRQGALSIQTPGQGLTDITDKVADWVVGQSIATGMLNLFCQHTSASLVIQENADPDVLRDLETFFKRLVGEDPSLYRHTAEGADDMPAHIRSALTQTSLNVPVQEGRLALGTWQGIYVFEHRRRPHTRRLVLHLVGE